MSDFSKFQEILFSERLKIPSIPGVYLIYANDTCLYIGSSSNLNYRINGHPKKKIFFELNASIIKYEPLDDVFNLHIREGKLVRSLQPSLNSYASKSNYEKSTKHSNLVRRRLGFNKHFEFSEPGMLRKRAYELLNNRDKSSVLLTEISKETTLPLPWLKSFQKRGNEFDSHSDRVVTLYEHLMQKKLKI